MPESSQIPEGEYKLGKFMGSTSEAVFSADPDGSGQAMPHALVEGMSVKRMKGVGLAKEDAILIRSLISEVPEALRYRLRQMDITLKRGEDQRLHVTQIGPIDEIQGAWVADAAATRTGERIPEIEALKHVGDEGASIVQQNVVDLLKQHLPYRFRLDEEAPPLSHTSSLVLKALRELVGDDEQSKLLLEFVSRKEPQDMTDERVRHVHQIEEINVYVPMDQKLPEPLQELVNKTQAEHVNGGVLEHYSIKDDALRLVLQLAQRSGGRGYIEH